ncbi:MAG TPA: hypothetical protein VGL55_11330 [Steroidobacteraceae bacterium]|jgi:hypothetical protein
MNRRLEALEARRQDLLVRCEAQRLELAYRLTQVGPTARLDALKRRMSPLGAAHAAANHPLAWIAGVAGLLMMVRTRKLLTGVTWIGGLIALASRTTTLLRVFAQLRALINSMKQPRR